MLTLLINIFIKNKNDVKNPKVREKYGILCGGYGIFLNLVLFTAKYVAGILSASIAMTADAFNNLSDAGSSLISLLGFKLAGQKPDPEHPFGHGRLEYLSGLIVSAVIVLMGYELSKDSAVRIIHPEETVWSAASLIILILSVAVKFYMAAYTKSIGRRIDSGALLATSADSLSDTISTFAVLACTILSHFTGIKIDGWCGLLVGLLILWAGIKTAKDTIDPLLGTKPSKEFVTSIEEIVMKHEEIKGVHDLIVHDYGPGRLMITLHAEVPSNGVINDLHDVIDCAEKELHDKLGCHAVIHMDPIEIGNVYCDEMKSFVSEIIAEYDNTMTFHDFRVVTGPTHTNLIFDVVASYSKKESDDKIKEDISELIHVRRRECFAVISVDRDFAEK